MDVSKVKAALSDAIGAEAVTANPDVLSAYTTDSSLYKGHSPILVARPTSFEQVLSTVELANRHKFGVVPVSSGPPHYLGDTVPAEENCVVLDLEGMKKIIRLDRRNRVAMVEPGVKWGELIEAGKKVGLRPNPPLCPRPGKSVLGSCLEREPVIMPKYMWDISDPLLCTELVWGAGAHFRTGSAAGPGSLEDQWRSGQAQKNPMGPGQFDPMRIVQGAQGTMGVVTWITLKMEILPEIHKMFLVGSDDLDKLITPTYALQFRRLGDETILLNRLSFGQIIASGNGKTPREITQGLPEWILLIGLSGLERLPEKRYAYQESDSKEVMAKHGLQLGETLGNVHGDEVKERIWSPAEKPFWKDAHKGAHQPVFFLTTLNETPRFIEVVRKICAEHDYALDDLGIYIQPLIQGRCCHVEFILTHEPDEKESLTPLFETAGRRLADEGAFYSRPYGLWNELAFSKSPGVVDVWKKVKAIFDPARVMNPGRLCY